MKILFFTPSFYPTTGGLESVARSLAKGLSEQNYIVKILTFTPLQDAQEINEGYEIIRTTHKLDIFKLYLDCNIFVHHNISLKGIWPLFLFPKKWVVLHHLTYYDFNGKLTFLERIKRYLSILANNVSVSNFVNQTLPKKGEVIHNPYNEDIFYLKSHLKRAHRLLFVGRLVSDKGCLLLLESIHKLKMEGIEVYLSIIGDGPEQAKLKKYCRDKKIEKLVNFLGLKTGSDLADEYNKHQTLVIPSIWKEPFGIVALEGIACGCNIIVSDGDGLIESSLGCGYPFIKGDCADLVSTIKKVHLNGDLDATYKIPSLLKEYSQSAVAKNWVKFFNSVYEN